LGKFKDQIAQAAVLQAERVSRSGVNHRQVSSVKTCSIPVRAPCTFARIWVHLTIFVCVQEKKKKKMQMKKMRTTAHL